MLKLLQNNRLDYLVVTPTTHLRDEWKSKLKLHTRETWRVSTWEMGLSRTASFVVVDEIYKLPPGYIDLLVHLNDNIKFLILLGDPLQGSYHSTNPMSTLISLPDESERLKPYWDVYCAWSYRLSTYTAKALGIQSLSSELGREPICVPLSKTSKMILTPAIDTSTILNSLGYHSMSSAASQGLTFNSNVCVFLDDHTKLMSPNVAIVALTRSRRSVHWGGDHRILNELASDHPFVIYNRGSGDLLKAYQRHLDGLLILYHPDAVPNLNLRGGLRDRNAPPFDPSYCLDIVSDRRQPLRGSENAVIPSVDDFFVPETKRIALLHLEDATPTAPAPIDSYLQAPSLEPVYPGCDYEALRHEFLRSKAPEDYEILFKGVLSNQFPHLNHPFELEAASPALIAPVHQQKNDPCLLAASITKRLRFTSEKVSHISPKEQILGELMFQAYCDAYGLDLLPLEFDHELFLSCISENEFIQLSSKSHSVIIANEPRCDPEKPLEQVHIFSKTQHKINLNSLFTSWKACQTLALMHDLVVLTLGPVKKYQRAMLARISNNPKIFVYGGKSPRHMSSFAQTNFPYGCSRVANDYSAFDQSQRGESTYFELLKMQKFGIPEEFQHFHKFLKMNLYCQFGRLAPMRFTGEPGTYDDNTDYNLAVLALEYDLTGVPLLVSGDDSLLAWEPPTKPTWVNILPLFDRLTWKKERSLYGEFCGFYVSSCGAVRAPRPMLAKLALSKARDELHLTLPSYLSEFVVGHSLGDNMWLALPPSEILYQSAVFDFFCRHASPELKVALKQGEVPPDLLLKTGGNVSRLTFADMNAAQRWAYIKLKHPSYLSWAVDIREAFM